jgi:hypothetical protein
MLRIAKPRKLPEPLEYGDGLVGDERDERQSMAFQDGNRHNPVSLSVNALAAFFRSTMQRSFSDTRQAVLSWVSVEIRAIRFHAKYRPRRQVSLSGAFSFLIK